MSINKKAGTLYEQIFICEALQKGLNVSVPIGDYLPYDLVIDNGKKLQRIQVKGTSHKQSSGYKVTIGKGNSLSRKKVRDKDSFDILAIVVMENGNRHWYLIPERSIGNIISLKVFPNPESKGKYEKYKHGWNLICT